MKIETKFDIGETVYGIQRAYITDAVTVIGPMTIGQVRVEITDSPGLEGETLFSNYMPQKKYEEGYMCIETGIGTGTIHKAENLFRKKEDAIKRASLFLKDAT